MDDLRPLSDTDARDPLAHLVRRARAFDVDYDVEAGLARHHRAVADGVTPSVTTAAGVSKWGWVVLATALVTGVWLSTRSTASTIPDEPRPEVATSTSVTLSSPRAAVVATTPAATPTTAVAPADAPPIARDLAPPPTASRRTKRVDSATAVVEPEPAVVEPAPDDLIAREAAQVRAIRNDLAAGRAAAALRACDDGDSSFADGVFSVEREGLRVLALFELGRREEGERAASRYLDAHPHGALVAKIRAARDR